MKQREKKKEKRRIEKFCNSTFA